MIPLYYKGEKFITHKSVMQRLRIGQMRLDGLIWKLENEEVVMVHGHRLFMDEEGVRAKRRSREMAELRKLMKEKRSAPDVHRTTLLAPGYCVHRLGVWHG